MDVSWFKTDERRIEVIENLGQNIIIWYKQSGNLSLIKFEVQAKIVHVLLYWFLHIDLSLRAISCVVVYFYVYKYCNIQHKCNLALLSRKTNKVCGK